MPLLGAVADAGERHLVRAPVPFDRDAVDVRGPVQPFGYAG